jgi:hypothetical protein
VVKGKYHQKIKDTRIADPGWGRKHWATIENAYAQARHFRDQAGPFEQLYLDATYEWLSEVNYAFLVAICDVLGIQTRLSWSMDYRPTGTGPNELILSLCAQAGATEYLSGPSARDYLSVPQFEQQGVALRFVDYDGYPVYQQVHPPFDHHVSVLDVIFNTGPDAPRYLKSFGSAGADSRRGHP